MIWSSLLLLLFQKAAAWHTDDDLMSFVTLPDVRAVKFDIHYEHRERVGPGYWFVAPYLHIDPDQPTSLYEQYQTGPHIYDQDGHLVWTGSPMFDNRNVFDFKVVNSINNESHLSLILQYTFDGSEHGYGILLNNNYDVFRKIPLRDDLGYFDIHEFNVLDNGRTALVTSYLSKEISLEAYGRPEEKTWLEYGGFAELDINTADVVYHWDSLAEVPLQETVHYHPDSQVEGAPGWDYVHINSVDKNADGDYLISMRFTNTIYMISGKDGRIMWRLRGQGGSDFAQDFVFSKQHDAKFVESSGTRHVISFLNNASDEEFNEEDTSSALVVELEAGTTPMTARVLRRYIRPDHELTRLRGNTQLLPDGNVFVCWSQGGYISEFSSEGEVLMTAQFTSPRYSNYRAYKFEFSGRPNTPPDLVASVYGSDEMNLVTTIHVSWNGATDVALWNFYAQASQFDDPVFIGNVSKVEFETMFIASGYMDWVSVEAVDRDGHVLGTSEVHRTQFPDWNEVGWSGSSARPKPQDPSTLHYSGSESSINNVTGQSSPLLPGDAAELQLIKATQMIAYSYETLRSIGGLFAVILLLGVMCGILASCLLIRGWRVRLYRRMRLEEGVPEEETHLRSEMTE